MFRRFAAAISLSLATCLAACCSALAAGAVSGTATEAGTGTPIAGLSVCAEENYLGGVNSRCTGTDTAGNYVISSLPAGSRYQVEFSVPPVGTLNFLTQYWQGKEGLNNWDPVTISDGITAEGINAVMNPGAQVSGHLSEQGSDAAVADVRVCVLDPAPNPRAEEFERCATSDAAGNYLIRALLAGTYIVSFAHYPPLNLPSPFVEQYYAGAAEKATATPIAIAPPESRAGIDAVLINRLQTTLRRSRGFRTVTRSRRVKVGFRFFAGDGTAGFICKRDRKSWRPCRSPQRFWASIGRHAFRVRAVGPTGEKGPVASSRFRVRPIHQVR